MQIQERDTIKHLMQFYSAFYQIRMSKLRMKGQNYFGGGRKGIYRWDLDINKETY